MTVDVSVFLDVSDKVRGGEEVNCGIFIPVTDTLGTSFVSRQRAVNLYAYPVSVTSTGNSRLTAFCIGDNMRFCVKCWTEKDESEFEKYKWGYDNLRTTCKQCNGETNHLRWKASPEKKRQYKRNHRALKISNGGKITSKEWDDLKRKYDYTCLRCRKQEPEIKLTLDHINPLILGGLNIIDNAQPLCNLCNSIKGKKYVDYR